MEGFMHVLAFAYSRDRTTGEPWLEDGANTAVNVTKLRLLRKALGHTYNPVERFFLIPPMFADTVTVPEAPKSPFATGSTPTYRSLRLKFRSNGRELTWSIEFVSVDTLCLDQNNVYVEGFNQASGSNKNSLYYTFPEYNTIIQNCSTAQYWDPPGTEQILDRPGFNDFVIISEPVAEGIFADSEYSLSGLYAGIILVIANGIRGVLKDVSQKIIFEDMENPSKPLSICVHIARARECGDHELEHDLYLYLIDLFRQPQKLYHATTRAPPRPNGMWAAEMLPQNRRPPLELVEVAPQPSSEELAQGARSGAQYTR